MFFPAKHKELTVIFIQFATLKCLCPSAQTQNVTEMKYLFKVLVI